MDTTINPALNPDLESMSDDAVLFWLEVLERGHPLIPDLIAEAEHRELSDLDGEPY